jgi:phage baseplate assembly protein W
MAEPIESIRYPVAIDAGLGQVAQETDYAEHVKQLMLQVLFTNPGERVNRPDFGCGLRRMVFAPNSDAAASLTQVTIYQALDRWLGNLIEVSEVNVQAIEEVLQVQIAYILRARQERRYLNLEVTL